MKSVMHFMIKEYDGIVIVDEPSSELNNDNENDSSDSESDSSGNESDSSDNESDSDSSDSESDRESDSNNNKKNKMGFGKFSKL